MSDDKRRPEVENEKFEDKGGNGLYRDQASYQPEKSELDDNKPPQEDSES